MQNTFNVYLFIILIVLCNFKVIASETYSSICGVQKEKNTKSICDCSNESSSQEGLLVIRIDCNLKHLNSTFLANKTLPNYAEELNLVWNNLEVVPEFKSEHLRRLNLKHNRITNLNDKNFVNTPGLVDVDLSWNGLMSISVNAFHGLRFLKMLNLRGNKISPIHANIFSPLVSLESLDLSWNSKLNETVDIQSKDFIINFGVTPKLRVLKMVHCNLNNIDLSSAVSLTEVQLGWNNFNRIEKLPRSVKFLDLSGNNFEILNTSTIPRLFQLEILLFEDMPNLRTIDEYALFGFPKLRLLSLQNSKFFKYFHPFAFGEIDGPKETNVSLKSLSLRGTSVKRLNVSLLNAFVDLESLDLSGTPLVCDCKLRWLHDLNLDTGGQCNNPIDLRGLQLMNVLSMQFVCNETPSWMSQLFNGLLILVLLILCSAGIWLIVMGLRPSHTKSKPKVGSNSPYARITIEPNQVENYA